MLDWDLREVWSHYSEVPACLMDLENGLKVGAPANFCLLSVAQPNQLQSLTVYVQGELIGKR